MPTDALVAPFPRYRKRLALRRKVFFYETSLLPPALSSSVRGSAKTGLYNYGKRYYDPVTGRWPSKHPIEEQGGLNLYGFVNDDPLGYHDPSGLKRRRRSYRIIGEGDSLWMAYIQSPGACYVDDAQGVSGGANESGVPDKLAAT